MTIIFVVHSTKMNGKISNHFHFTLSLLILKIHSLNPVLFWLLNFFKIIITLHNTFAINRHICTPIDPNIIYQSWMFIIIFSLNSSINHQYDNFGVHQCRNLDQFLCFFPVFFNVMTHESGETEKRGITILNRYQF